MSKFLQFLKEYDYRYFVSDRINLDEYNIGQFEDLGEGFERNKIFETDKTGGVKSICTYCLPDEIPSIFKYFIDGSRKIYKLGSIIVENQYAPIVAGQVGAVCCTRENGYIKRHDLLKENVLLLTKNMNNIDFEEIRKKIEAAEVKGVKVRVQKVNYDKKEKEKHEDIASAKVNSLMQDKEIELITKMASSNYLDTDKMLIVDGSLKFLTQDFDENIFKNVIGVAKNFDVNKTDILKNDQDIGSYLVQLKEGQRTQVYKFPHKNVVIGAWYLRIRESKHLKNPLDGIVKVEKVAMKCNEEHIDGLDSEVVDNISCFLLKERNVTSYGKEDRWHKHLYSMYLTEKYLKNSFISDDYFINVF